jgi:hypothetical protein
MSNAVRRPILPELDLAPEAEELASAYLNSAEGNSSLALRLATADRISDLHRLQARVAQLQSLVSCGYARWGARHGER